MHDNSAAARRLAAAVIRRAVNDAAGRIERGKRWQGDPEQKHKIMAEAMAWLTTESAGLRYWCHLLDLDVEDIIQGSPGAVERTALRERALGGGRKRADGS